MNDNQKEKVINIFKEMTDSLPSKFVNGLPGNLKVKF